MQKVDYRKVYLTKSDKFLLDIYKNKRNNYEDEVITTIEQVLKERNIAFDKIEIINDKQVKSNAVDYTPMLVGMLAILIGGLILYMNKSGDEMGFGIWYTVILRIIFIAYSINLSDKYAQNKPLWIILILLFGGWALVFQNIAFIVSNTKPDYLVLEPLSNTDTSFSILPKEIKVATVYDINEKVESKNGYINCPACLKSLNGTNKCIDCDLEFE
jgi:hypothetical protein